MELFSYKGYTFTYRPETYQLAPFRAIIDRDSSADKRMALLELSYIYFFADPSSDYQIYIDPDERRRQIKIGQGMPEWWEPDAAVYEAISFYESFSPPSVMMLKAARRMAYNIQEVVESLDMTEQDDNGRLRMKAKEIKEWMEIARQIPQVIKDLDEAEKALKREIAERTRVKGGAELSILDEDLNI